MKQANKDTWICPLCYVPCAFGKSGCDDPEKCPNDKNINYLIVYSKDVKFSCTSIGIAEIAEESKTPR